MSIRENYKIKPRIYQCLTPSQARELKHILEESLLEMIHVMMHLDGTDTYEIRVKKDTNAQN